MSKTKITKLESFRDLVLKEYKKGNVVVSGIEGFQTIPLQEIIDQPTDGLLYDLNRMEQVILTFIEDRKWVNDFAVCKVIRELKKQVEELTEKENLLTNNELIKSFYYICKRKGKNTNWEGITKKIELILKPK